MKDAEANGNKHYSHFGPYSNLLEELEALFKGYGEHGSGRVRKYVHDAGEAAEHGVEPGTLHRLEGHRTRFGPDVLRRPARRVRRRARSTSAATVDLLVGVVPIINLEWIQKLHRDKKMRGYSQEAVVDTILRRMPDYVNHIVPQFSVTHVNFQRVPVVDTSNPFIARDIPSADESMVIIRFTNPKGIDLPYLLSMLHDSVMTRPNTIIVPGGKMGLAMQLIFTPMILRLMDQKRRAH